MEFIIIGVFVGLFLAVVLAPIIIIGDKKKLREVNKKINEFEVKSFITPEEKEREKLLLKKELIQIKAKIMNKNTKEEVGDKINLL